MNIITAAIRTDSFACNIRTYIPAAASAIISRAYGSKSFPAIPANGASFFDTVPAAIGAFARPK